MIYDAKCDELRAEMKKRNRREKRTKNNQLGAEEHNSQQTQPQSVANDDNGVASFFTSACSISSDHEEALIEQACVAINSHPPHHHTASSSGIYQCLYQSILFRHMRYRAPIFNMGSSVKLGEPYGLHFFEPRYRVLISEIMSQYPVSARRGNPIAPILPGLIPQNNAQRRIVMDAELQVYLLDLLEKNESILQEHNLPTFIHAHQSPLRRNIPATIVQVQMCAAAPDGSADVFLNPIAYIWLEDIWERPGTGGLLEGRGIRMGTKSSKAYERWSGMSAYTAGDGRGRENQLPIP